MRISDWSSDVCSSDLGRSRLGPKRGGAWQGMRLRLPWLWSGAGGQGADQPAAASAFRPPHRHWLPNWARDWNPSQGQAVDRRRSEEHTSELQSLMRISYAVFCLKKKTQKQLHKLRTTHKTKYS